MNRGVRKALARPVERNTSDRLERLRNLSAGANEGAWSMTGASPSLPLNGKLFCRFPWAFVYARAQTAESSQVVFGDHPFCIPCVGFPGEFNRAVILAKLEDSLPAGSSRPNNLLLEPSETVPEPLHVSAVLPKGGSKRVAEALGRRGKRDCAAASLGGFPRALKEPTPPLLQKQESRTPPPSNTRTRI